jgi:hypothetical protein
MWMMNMNMTLAVNGVSIYRTITASPNCCLYQTSDGNVYLDLDPDCEDTDVRWMGKLWKDSTEEEILKLANARKGSGS